ncbi:Crp/Fnr family transcriptional regulator [Haloechinothrix salitolerans]|uniref:Crp/Fnr family transcriptional regulator n=1 Tax=Haloechinothrix salitolerans TaxID=926830 RepID=A0ABW2C2P5_9PSEU
MTHLASLSGDDRRKLREAGKPRRYGRREIIWHEGDPGDTLHFIDEGRVAVRVTTPMGEMVTLSILGKGDAFGELALLDPGSVRTATVITLEPTMTLAIHRDSFHALRNESSTIDAFLLSMMSAYVRRLSGQVLEALYLPVDKRVERQLARLATLYADRAGRDATVAIPLTQEEIAGLAGTTRATVNRVLRELEDAAIVSLSRGRVTVTDPRRLSAR